MLLLLTRSCRSACICQSVKSCRCALFWHSQKTPTEAWPQGSAQSAQRENYYEHFQYDGKESKNMGEAMRILYLYLKAEDRFKDHDVREKKVSLNWIWASFCVCPLIQKNWTLDIYLLCDIAFVVYGCQVTQDQFSGLSLPWPTFSTGITKTTNMNDL